MDNSSGALSKQAFLEIFLSINTSSKKIKYISHHHEQAASFAAESYARSKNSIGCCFVTTGPGGTNTLTGNLLTPGYFYAIEGVDDVSQLSFDNFYYFTSYPGGLRELKLGDADGDGNPNANNDS